LSGNVGQGLTDIYPVGFFTRILHRRPYNYYGNHMNLTEDEKALKTKEKALFVAAEEYLRYVQRNPKRYANISNMEELFRDAKTRSTSDIKHVHRNALREAADDRRLPENRPPDQELAYFSALEAYAIKRDSIKTLAAESRVVSETY
jgi:hypothetical protein